MGTVEDMVLSKSGTQNSHQSEGDREIKGKFNQKWISWLYVLYELLLLSINTLTMWEKKAIVSRKQFAGMMKTVHE